MPRAPWDPPEAAAPPEVAQPAPSSDAAQIAPNPTPGCSRDCDTNYWPGMDDVVPGFYGGKVEIRPHAHLWHFVDLWNEYVSYCGIVVATKPEPITDPTATRCPCCAECPTDRRRARP